MTSTTSLRRIVACALFVIAGLCALPAAAQTTTKTADDAKITHLLDGCGHLYKTYTTASGPVWSIEELHGTGPKTMRMLVATSSGVLMMGVVVAEKAHMNVTPEFMHQLLRMTHNIDRVKIGFDNDEDLFVRIETPMRLLDAQDFKAQIDQVVAATDEIRKQASAFISQ